MCKTCGCSSDNKEERTYRPKLETLALQLYKARETKRDAEEDITPQIKDMLDRARITKYDGKKVIVNLVTPIQQEANLKKLLKKVPLQTLYKNNLLAINL